MFGRFDHSFGPEHLVGDRICRSGVSKRLWWRSRKPLKDKVLGPEGAVIFLEKVSGTLAHVDSSSGAIGMAVNRAIDTLAPIVSQAPASDDLRDRWLERLWRAIEDDEIPYIELLPDHWGELCVTSERASRWADRFIEVVRFPRGGFFKGTAACLSALFSAGRHEELLNLLDLAPYKFWHDRRWGVYRRGIRTPLLG